MKYSFTRQFTGEPKGNVPEKVDGKMVFFLSPDAVKRINEALITVVGSYKTAKQELIVRNSAKYLKDMISQENEFKSAMEEWISQLKAYKHNPFETDN